MDSILHRLQEPPQDDLYFTQTWYLRLFVRSVIRRYERALEIDPNWASNHKILVFLCCFIVVHHTIWPVVSVYYSLDGPSSIRDQMIKQQAPRKDSKSGSNIIVVELESQHAMLHESLCARALKELYDMCRMQQYCILSFPWYLRYLILHDGLCHFLAFLFGTTWTAQFCSFMLVNLVLIYQHAQWIHGLVTGRPGSSSFALSATDTRQALIVPTIVSSFLRGLATLVLGRLVQYYLHPEATAAALGTSLHKFVYLIVPAVAVLLLAPAFGMLTRVEVSLTSMELRFGYVLARPSPGDLREGASSVLGSLWLLSWAIRSMPQRQWYLLSAVFILDAWSACLLVFTKLQLGI